MTPSKIYCAIIIITIIFCSIILKWGRNTKKHLISPDPLNFHWFLFCNENMVTDTVTFFKWKIVTLLPQQWSGVLSRKNRMTGWNLFSFLNLYGIMKSQTGQASSSLIRYTMIVCCQFGAATQQSLLAQLQCWETRHELCFKSCF